MKTFVSKSFFTITAGITLLWGIMSFTLTKAQPIQFDFDNAPIYSSMPLNQTTGGITAYFAATGQGFSIQNANVLGFTPQGFAGRCIYPNSIYRADLLIRFSQPLTAFSIMYSPQELGCDNSATMKVTAYLNGTPIGFTTKTAANPGTWPTDTLRCSFTQGFDSVVVHYDSPPPTCQDYGVIFMADNMEITPVVTAIQEQDLLEKVINISPNPGTGLFIITYTGTVFAIKKDIIVYNSTGDIVITTVSSQQKTIIDLTGKPKGIYYVKIIAGINNACARKIILQ